MALLRGHKSEMPDDAIMLTEEEALRHQLKVMNAWKNKSDTFIFRYGGAILGSLSASAGVFMNSHYRLKFKLLNYGRASSYLPICVIPAALSILLHTEFVVSDILLQKSCVICTELRSSAIQAMAGCVFPAVLAPLSAIPLAMQYNTYNIPYITKEPMKVFRIWQKHTKPIGNTLFAIFIGQALVASVIAYFEMKSVYKVSSTLAKIEYDMEHSGS